MLVGLLVADGAVGLDPWVVVPVPEPEAGGGFDGFAVGVLAGAGVVGGVVGGGDLVGLDVGLGGWTGLGVGLGGADVGEMAGDGESDGVSDGLADGDALGVGHPGAGVLE